MMMMESYRVDFVADRGNCFFVSLAVFLKLFLLGFHEASVHIVCHSNLKIFCKRWRSNTKDDEIRSNSRAYSRPYVRGGITGMNHP